jgi:hypothetical protein
MFRTLLTHPQEDLHKRHLVYCVRVMSVGCTRIGVEHQDYVGHYTIFMPKCTVLTTRKTDFVIFTLSYFTLQFYVTSSTLDNTQQVFDTTLTLLFCFSHQQLSLFYDNNKFTSLFVKGGLSPLYPFCEPMPTWWWLMHTAETCSSAETKTYIFGLFFTTCPYRLRGPPPGCGRSVTDFWGWGAHRAQLRCPDYVSDMYGRGVPGRVLNLGSTSYPDHGGCGDLPLQGKIPRTEPRIEPVTSWLVVRSSDHQATRLVILNMYGHVYLLTSHFILIINIKHDGVR